MLKAEVMKKTFAIEQKPWLRAGIEVDWLLCRFGLKNWAERVERKLQFCQTNPTVPVGRGGDGGPTNVERSKSGSHRLSQVANYERLAKRPGTDGQDRRFRGARRNHGRNVWGSPDPTRALMALRAVIHDRLKPDAALKSAGLFGK